MRNWIFKSEDKPVQANLVIVGFVSVFLVWSGPNANVGSATRGKTRTVSPQIRCLRPATTEPKFEIPDDLLDAVRFQKLVDQWRIERGATSSVEEMCTTAAYLSIMAIGPRALPMILHQLRSEGNNPDHWFVALHHITQGVDPVPDEDKGDMVRMAEAWLKWAQREGDAG